MPKPIPMTIHVEEVALGKVFRALDGMPGVVNISLHGAGPKSHGPNGSTKGQKRGGVNTVPCLVLGALIAANGKSLAREELAPAITSAGKKPASIPDALQKLGKLKCITRKSGRISITATGRKHYQTACTVENGGE